ncbi:MAG: hypothetical protein WBH44_07420 [Proteocatella sp.]
MRNSKKYFIFSISALMVSTMLIFLSGCSIMNASIDSVQGYAKDYLNKVLTIDLKKVDVDSFSADSREKDMEAMNKYLNRRFEKYFTEDGYQKFIDDELYSRRVNYFKEADIKDILNIIITLELDDKRVDTGDMLYNYSIEYYVVNTSDKSEKVVDRGQLEILKQSNGRYRIENDEAQYSDIFS